MEKNRLNTPLVSVIMPILSPNLGFLRETLESLQAQTLTDWELVVMEESTGTHPTAAGLFAEPAYQQDKRIRYFFNEERTTYREQVIRAFEAIRSDLVARLDCDDVASPERLEKQYCFLQENPQVDVVGAFIDVIDEKSELIGRREYPTSHDAMIAAMKLYNPIAHPVTMFRKESVERSGGYQHPLLDDYDLWCRMAKAGHRFASLPESLLRYRLHGSSLKSSKTKETLRATIAIKREYWRGELGLRGWFRIGLERILLLLPTSLILWLFQRMTLKNR